MINFNTLKAVKLSVGHRTYLIYTNHSEATVGTKFTKNEFLILKERYIKHKLSCLLKFAHIYTFIFPEKREIVGQQHSFNMGLSLIWGNSKNLV